MADDECGPHWCYSRSDDGAAQGKPHSGGVCPLAGAGNGSLAGESSLFPSVGDRSVPVRSIPMISEVVDQRRAPSSDNGSEVRPYMAGANKRDWYPWVIVAFLWMVCFFSYADRQAFFSVFPLLQQSLHLTTVQLGLLGSSFAVVYGVAGPFAGLVADRIRRKTAIIVGLQFWSIICTVSALSSTFMQLLIFRGLEGLGECIYSPAAMSMVSDYHDKRSRSKAMGILQTSVYAGTVGGGYWAASIAQRHGWRPAIFFFGGMGCLLGLALIKLMREPKRKVLE